MKGGEDFSGWSKGKQYAATIAASGAAGAGIGAGIGGYGGRGGLGAAAGAFAGLTTGAALGYYNFKKQEQDDEGDSSTSTANPPTQVNLSESDKKDKKDLDQLKMELTDKQGEAFTEEQMNLIDSKIQGILPEAKQILESVRLFDPSGKDKPDLEEYHKKCRHAQEMMKDEKNEFFNLEIEDLRSRIQSVYNIIQYKELEEQMAQEEAQRELGRTQIGEIKGMCKGGTWRHSVNKGFPVKLIEYQEHPVRVTCEYLSEDKIVRFTEQITDTGEFLEGFSFVEDQKARELETPYREVRQKAVKVKEIVDLIEGSVDDLTFGEKKRNLEDKLPQVGNVVVVNISEPETPEYRCASVVEVGNRQDFYEYGPESNKVQGDLFETTKRSLVALFTSLTGFELGDLLFLSGKFGRVKEKRYNVVWNEIYDRKLMPLFTEEGKHILKIVLSNKLSLMDDALKQKDIPVDQEEGEELDQIIIDRFGLSQLNDESRDIILQVLRPFVSSYRQVVNQTSAVNPTSVPNLSPSPKRTLSDILGEVHQAKHHQQYATAFQELGVEDASGFTEENIKEVVKIKPHQRQMLRYLKTLPEK